MGLRIVHVLCDLRVRKKKYSNRTTKKATRTVAKTRRIPLSMMANEPKEMDWLKPCLAYTSVLSAIKETLIGDKAPLIINMCHSEFYSYYPAAFPSSRSWAASG